ncbi:hypothetical protein I317_04301 [Kwoniella heveanensis CBS 569]|nr:hypothetical protein I317_04301 [Kwoniella heveanensis CBS 569]
MAANGQGMSTHPTQTEDELRDLNDEDAQELRNFLEKRRWFEGKLKILEAIPPIYPFLHLHVDTKSEQILDAEAGPSNWRLPNVDQVKQWQKERDQIEEEVLDFDGGDLVRIKKKTRAATQLPLTAPSTHLVSITLDLVVLVDQLLKLLRHRGELLQLTRLRLDWDRIRCEVVSETAKIREEVDSIVRDQGRWTPAVDPKIWTPVTPRSNDLDTVPPQTPPRSALATLPSIASSLSSLQLSDSPGGRSPSRAHSTPKRSLHVPLLHSQLINVKIRHQTLATTKLSRSGVILDRMIDIAGPLKGLGDVNGPIGADKDSGAVPDELLDVQDELEEEVRRLGDKVSWCKDLEEHWKRSEAYYLASSQALLAAERALSDLRSSLTEPATSERHRQLAAMVRIAQTHVPPALDSTFPNPTHPDYPENDQHNAEVVTALKAGREEATQTVNKCLLALEWYAKLASAREELLSRRIEAFGSSGALRTTFDLLKNGTMGTKRPDLEKEEEVMASEQWSKRMTDWKTEATAQADAARLNGQRTILAIQQYRNASRLPSALQDGHFHYEDDCITDVDNEAEALLQLSRSVIEEARTATHDKELVDIGRPMLCAARSILAKQEALSGSLDTALEQSSWPENSSVADEGFKKELSQLEQRMNADMITPYDEFLFQRKVFGCIGSTGESFNTVDRVISNQKDLGRKCGILERLRGQAAAIIIILQEADKFLYRIHEVREEPSQALDSLKHETETWLSTVASRMPFIAHEPSRPSDHGAASKSMTSSSILAPVATIDLVSIDQRARDMVNERTLQVAAAVAEVEARQADLRWTGWTERCHQAAERIDQVLSGWQEYQGHLADRNDHNSVKSIDQARIEDLTSAIQRHVTCMREAVHAMEQEVECVLRDRRGREKEILMWQSAVEAARMAIDEAVAEAEGWLVMVHQRRESLHDRGVFSSHNTTVEPVEVLEGLEEGKVISDFSDSGSNGVQATTMNRPSSVMSVSRLPRLSGSLPRAIASRSASNPKAIFGSPTLTRSLSRTRAVSDTPSRTRPHSLGSSGIPRRRQETAKVPLMAMAKPITKGYVANPQNRLDVAVGEIVNKLDVGMPIRPVGYAGDEWQDKSGQYWIGAEGRARLCFCRILRSRTVMVRVGGGWIELSRFLLDHFADAVVGNMTGGETMPPSQSNSSLASILSDVPSTPPRLVKSVSSQSLDRGSPLAAFQFMKKASQSPSVREKEKELFHGRRSILGK